MKGQEESFEVRHHPNLTYCAMYFKKADNVNSSWDTISTNLLREKTGKLLSLHVVGGDNIPDKVKNRLLMKGKKVTANDKEIFTYVT